MKGKGLPSEVKWLIWFGAKEVVMELNWIESKAPALKQAFVFFVYFVVILENG